MEIYALLRIVIGIIVALVFLFGIAIPIFVGKSSPLSKINEKVKSPFCDTDADCEEGVCVSGECICFLDSQCKNKCDMSIGLCD